MVGLEGRSGRRVIVGPLTQMSGSKCPWSVLSGLGEGLTGGMGGTQGMK